MSVYKIIELVGTSPNSWEEASKQAVETATKTLRDIRIAEVDQLDMRDKWEEVNTAPVSNSPSSMRGLIDRLVTNRGD